MILNITKLPTYYINLDDRPDRKSRVESILSGNNFSNYHRFPAKKAGKRVGCSMSHAELLKKIIKENTYPVLVLEDDIEVYDIFKKEIDCPDDADAMYLGFSAYGYNHDRKNKGLRVSEVGLSYHRMHNMLARHAIIHFSKEYDQECVYLMEKFIKDPDQYIAGDVTLSSIHSKYKVYAQNTPVFYQKQEGTRYLTKRSLHDCKYIDLDNMQ
jgi:GR25 family glycosyltransferase involved in LPS biosynthesis